jgi:hypothetical protein
MKNSFTDEERHAFVLGIADGFNPLKSPHDARLPTPPYIIGEQHYYKGGRAIGLLLLLIVSATIYHFFLS